MSINYTRETTTINLRQRESAVATCTIQYASYTNMYVLRSYFTPAIIRSDSETSSCISHYNFNNINITRRTPHDTRVRKNARSRLLVAYEFQHHTFLTGHRSRGNIIDESIECFVYTFQILCNAWFHMIRLIAH